jgi:hypothetical protein
MIADITNLFIGWLFLGFIVTLVVEAVKKLTIKLDEVKTLKDVINLFAPIIFGMLLVFGIEGLLLINMVLGLLETSLKLNIFIDKIITGLIISQGANGVKSIFNIVHELLVKRGLK